MKCICKQCEGDIVSQGWTCTNGLFCPLFWCLLCTGKFKVHLKIGPKRYGSFGSYETLKKSLFSCLKSKIKSLKENLFNSFKLIFCANKTLCEEEKTFQIHLLEGSTWNTRWLNLVTQLLILVCFVSVFTQYLSFHIC